MRTRFWVEVGLGALGLVLGIVTAVVPNWMEALTGAEPDGGTGAAEWAVVGGLLAFAAVSAVAASAEFATARRASG